MNNLFDDFYLELYLRVELRTSSLPRKCSTTELIQQQESGKRGSNPRPPAWKASALSTELFPLITLYWLSPKTYWHLFVGADGFEPPKSKDSRFTVCPIWPLWKTPVPFVLSLLSDSNQRPRDYKSRALAN